VNSASHRIDSGGVRHDEDGGIAEQRWVASIRHCGQAMPDLESIPHRQFTLIPPESIRWLAVASWRAHALSAEYAMVVRLVLVLDSMRA
jgi:hypothetical protein